MFRVVPEVVKHADFMEAIKPLLDLLQVEASEILSDIHIISDADALARVTFSLVPHVEVDDGAYPPGVPAFSSDLVPRVQESSEWVIPVTVKVV